MHSWSTFHFREQVVDCNIATRLSITIQVSSPSHCTGWLNSTKKMNSMESSSVHLRSIHISREDQEDEVACLATHALRTQSFSNGYLLTDPQAVWSLRNKLSSSCLDMTIVFFLVGTRGAGYSINSLGCALLTSIPLWSLKHPWTHVHSSEFISVRYM